MTPGESAANAVFKFAQRYSECRKLDAEIYGKPPAKLPDLSAAERGESFILSALYGLNLDMSERKLCFRCCRKDEAISPPLSPASGIFDFIQTLMNLAVANINREPGTLKSYSESLAVPLFRYSRGAELHVNSVVTNSVVSGGVIIPLRELTSQVRMAGLARFAPSHAAVAICDVPFNGFDMYRGDWDLRKMNRKASYRKDREIITNAEPIAVYRDVDALRDFYVRAISGDGIQADDGRFPLIAEYLGNAENLAREQEYYSKLIKNRDAM